LRKSERNFGCSALRAYFPAATENDKRNAILQNLIALFQKNGEEYTQNLPLKLKSGKIVFSGKKTDIATMKSADMFNLQPYATAQNCYDAMVEKYGLEQYDTKTALQIGNRADHWCHKINPALFREMKKNGRASRNDAERIWYSVVNDGYDGGVDSSHYNSTRYHGINLHAFFTKGTVEFRLFNGTTHAGRIKAYVQFCLAMSAWAINCDHDNLHFKSVAGYTQQQKHDLMLRVLTKRLGMRGPEFKTARLHLTSAFLNVKSEKRIGSYLQMRTEF